MGLDPQTAWDAFVPFETATTIPAGNLVDHARIQPGERGLDVGCGTGVVAITAARRGAKMAGLDPSKALLQRAKENAAIAEVDVDWREGGAEAIPFDDAAFDIVLSQFGHIFAPKPARAIDEMLRVLKPGGRLAISVWDAEHFVGQLFSLLVQHGLENFSAPIIWGKNEERTRLFAGRVTEVQDTPGILFSPCLSPAHTLLAMGRALWPIAVLLDQLSSDPPALDAFRKDALALIAKSAEGNAIPQRYTIVSARKI